MSGGGWDELKKPIYEGIVKPHSKIGAEFSRGIGWDYGLEESKKGQTNPGRQVGKAAGYAAGYMLGSSLLGGAAGASGGGAEAAAMSPEISAGLLSSIPAEAGASAISPELLMSVEGAGPQAARTSLNAAPKIARGLMSGGGDKAAMQKFMVQQGMNMMQPQPQPQAQPGRPFQQAPQEQLPMPYGTPAGNSVGIPPGMSYQEWLKRKQAGLI